jgi:outer membrane protein assembly factor BamD (BamD/ComL family)
MKNLLALVTIILAIFLVSCSPSHDEMITKISKMETDLQVAPKADSNAVNELLGAYQNFASKYPKDTLAPDYLYKAAGLAVGFNRGIQAIDIYETIIKTYPEYRRVPECYFMEAFAWENVVGNMGKASEYYNKFLAKYPEHDLADDAQAAIKFLGKTPEEMVREFEKMNADSANTAEK